MIKQGLMGVVLRYVSRLRYPTLFLVTGGLFVADLFIPDVIPFADELLLGLLTLWIGKFKDRKKPQTLEGKNDRVVKTQEKQR